MSLPANAVLVGAARWLVEMQDGGLAHAREVLRASSAYSDITPHQYQGAMAWLRECGLVTDAGLSPLVSSADDVQRLVMEWSIVTAQPVWLEDADEQITSEDELPLDALYAGTELGLSPTEIVAAIERAQLKVDADRLNAIGAWGESEFARVLADGTSGSVEHVSQVDDSLGYDVFLRIHDNHWKFEVKTTVRTGRVRVYLTRHELDVAIKNEAWMLVLVAARPNEEITGLATVSREWLLSGHPLDRTPDKTWMTVLVEPPPSAIAGGIDGLPVRSDADLRANELIRRGTRSGVRPPLWLRYGEPTTQTAVRTTSSGL